MKRRLARFLAVLWLLLFPGVQMAAFAHWAGHLAAPAAAGLESGHGESGLAAVLGQSCTSCAAFAGLDAALPGSPPDASAVSAMAEPALAAPQEKSVSAIRRYDPRAPPVFL